MRARMPLLIGALLVPAAVAYLVLFAGPQSVVHHPGGLVLGAHSHGFARALASPLYRRLLAETAKLAGLCALVCLVLAYPLAWGMRVVSDRLRRIVVFGVLAPMLLSVLMRGLGWMVVLGEFGLVNLVLRTLRLEADLSRRSHLISELAVLGSMVEVFFPFMLLALYGAAAKIDPALLRAARNLGATRLRAFFLVVVPLTLPGAAVGVVTVFALATGAYVTVAAYGARHVRSLAEAAAEESATLMNWQLAAAAAVLAAAAAAILLRLLLGSLRGAEPSAPSASTARPDPT